MKTDEGNMEAQHGQALECSSCGAIAVVDEGSLSMQVCTVCGMVSQSLASGAFTATPHAGVMVDEEGVAFANQGRHSAGPPGAVAVRGDFRGRRYSKPFFLRRPQSLKDSMIRKVKEISGKLALKSVVEQDAKRIMLDCCHGKHGKGRWAEVLSAACVYAACRLHSVALALVEVGDTISCNAYILGRVFSLLVRHMQLGPLPPLNPELFLERNASRLYDDLRARDPTKYKQILAHAKLLLSLAKSASISTGRHPLPLVVATLFLAGYAHDRQEELKQLATSLSVGLDAATLRVREINKVLRPMAKCLPWDLTNLKQNTLYLPANELLFLLQYLEAAKVSADGSLCAGNLEGDSIGKHGPVQEPPLGQDVSHQPNSSAKNSIPEVPTRKACNELAAKAVREDDWFFRILDIAAHDDDEFAFTNEKDDSPEDDVSLASSEAVGKRKRSNEQVNPLSSAWLPLSYVKNEQTRADLVHRIEDAKERIRKQTETAGRGDPSKPCERTSLHAELTATDKQIEDLLRAGVPEARIAEGAMWNTTCVSEADADKEIRDDEVIHMLRSASEIQVRELIAERLPPGATTKEESALGARVDRDLAASDHATRAA
mmetsp:Transcript_10417/g.38392  ORF Transcript_10417/g.38392 Transcript_10417/m.38392 type:complete len:603 (-) Transcript_10417:1540-3348(-)